MHTNFARLGPDQAPGLRSVRRLGMLALLAGVCLTPATAWGQTLYGRPVAQPFFDFPTWARFSDCRPDALPWGYDVFPEYGPIDCACDMPASVACPGDWVAHRPSTWYATAEFAPLTIDHLDGFDLVTTGVDGPVALRTDDLRPEFDAGGKFTVGRRIFDCYRIEGTFMGDYAWQDSVLVTSADTDLATFLTDFTAADGASAALSFESSFVSAEGNVRYWADMPPGPFDVSYLVGARYMRINDSYNFVTDAPAPVDIQGDALVATENEMIGVQIGIQGAWLLSTRWWFDFDLKGGMYNNRINLATSFIETDGGIDTETGAAISRDRTAWVGDLSMTANWQMTPSWTFRIGYQALFINGLALGSDNLVGNADLFGVNDARLDDSGELAFHGPTIGLTWMR